MNHRYAELDALRGIAALMVVFYHYTVRYGEIYGYSASPAFTFEIGQYGIHLFFMVSGFVICLTLDRSTHAADFLVSRVSRLFPAYWVAVIATATLTHLFSLPGREVGFMAAIVNLTMFQDWLNVGHVDGVYWTLTIELSFYLIMIGLFILDEIKRIERFCLIWLALIFLSHFLEAQYAFQIPWGIRRALILDYGNLFIAGVMFCKIMHSERVHHFFILFLSFVPVCWINSKVAIPVAVYYFVFLLFVKGKLSVIYVRPLAWLGAISYSLYLIHQNIGYLIIRYLEACQLATPVTVILIPLLITIASAAIVRFYIEIPALMWIRGTWKSSSLRASICGASASLGESKPSL